MLSELHYEIALTMVPNIGCVQGKILVEHLGSASAVFKARKSTLERIEGIGSFRAEKIRSFQDFGRVEKEIVFIRKYKINPLFLSHENYPRRLLNCCDSPGMLYYMGEANLNHSRVIAVIGTRQHTEYGKMLTEKLIKELAAEKVLVLSGLAFGIDTIAHKSSLKNSLPTVAVLAHGLDSVYPPENHRLARQMVAEGGGMLTEFMSGTKPDKHHFPTRNRIVAGMSDATVVIETDVKGGSMITAELANSYNRDVFAFPGKITDLKSRGCNQLIRTNKAALISSAQDLLDMMGWIAGPVRPKRIQRELFIELSPDEQLLVGLLQEKPQLHIDDIYAISRLSASSTASALLRLELQGIVMNLPGKLYKLA